MLGLEASEDAPRRTSHVVEQLKEIFSRIIASVSAFLLSLLFSFLIVWDLPRLTSSAMALRNTKLRFAFDEVVPTVVSFGGVLGKAFEAQLVIAFLNTILTALGVWAIGLDENIAFFSVIVFLCSFIPVAGVFISSVPICLLALQESGFNLMLLVVALITAIHMVETYILNPKIYGHHLRMNPVVVLILLTIGGKLFHIWGLILGVPICTYIFGTAINHGHGQSSEEIKLT
jgi:predicted PurR-regulated permease PerM